jgi:hypothetical protein
MAFLQGTTTDLNDFLGQVVTWLVGLGWTVNMAPTVNGNAGGQRAHLSKGAVYLNLQTALGDGNIALDWASAACYGLMLYLSDSYDAAQPYLTQPGGPLDLRPMRAAVAMPTFNFPIPYGRFFAFSDASDNVVIVLERRVLNFSAFGWGPSLAKAGTWSDGRYFFAEAYRSNGLRQDDASANILGDCPFNLSGSPTGFVRVDVDAFLSKWLGCAVPGFDVTGKVCYTGFGGSSPPTDVPIWAGGYARLAPSLLNSQALLVPVDIYAARDAGGSSLIGSVPNIFLTNAVGHGFGAAGIFSIGADNYMLFPGTGTGGYGYAIKKV